jgi:hypothetical protein
VTSVKQGTGERIVEDSAAEVESRVSARPCEPSDATPETLL